MKTIAELRADKPTGRPEHPLTLCLAPHLVAEARSLTNELAAIPTPAGQVDDDVAATGPPKKLGDPAAAENLSRAKKIRARLAAVLDEVAEHEGEMRLRANLTDGEWRRWANEHPARGEDVAGHERDERVTAGYCNADDLIDNLGKFVHLWNGDPITADDWKTIFEPVTGSGDLAEMARKVVEMYEGRVNFQLWRNSLSTNLKKLDDFDLPAN